MEDTKILTAYKRLASHVKIIESLDVSPQLKNVVHAVSKRLHAIEDAAKDVGTSFNASEQILSLNGAQKELDLLHSDILTLREANVLTPSQTQEITRRIKDLDAVIRAMSDPEYS